MRPSDMRKQGWSEMPDDGFLALVGPLWHKETEEGTIYAILTGAKHRNRSGVVQGGLICTLADRAMGMASRARSGNRRQVTITLTMQFLDKVELGELLIAKPRVVRQVRTLSFGAVELFADERLVASATATFRLQSEAPPPAQ